MIWCHNYTVLFMLLLLCSKNVGKILEINCTPKCRCDMYESLRRAVCDSGKMLNLKGNVPDYTEVLEIRDNYITKLENDEFANNNLQTLKLLNISHNILNEIGMFAFSEMENLRTLDLSYNSMQYVLLEWFPPLKSLQEFYISNNNLGALRNGPILESDSLKILDISSCEIPSLHSEVLSKLPNLEYLDVSGNNIFELQPEVLNQSQNLRYLNVRNNNQMRCSKKNTRLLEYCKKNNIELEYNFCPKSTKEEKYQRMTNTERKISLNAWMVEEHVLNQTECTAANKTRYYQDDRGLLVEIFEFSPLLSVIVLLLSGFLLGLTFSCMCKTSERTERQKPKKRKSNIFSDFVNRGNRYGNHFEMRSRDAPEEPANRRFRRSTSLSRKHPQTDGEDDRTGLFDDFAANPESTPMPSRRVIIDV